MHSFLKNPSVLVRNLMLLTLLTSMMSLGCALPEQPVVTTWQQLGIPQARHRIRDNWRNRSGDRPDREVKPRRLKIADPANLESPSDLLKGAAEIKADQDLAPQKIKALKFLAGVSCGCDEEKVEKAIIAGLEDCVADVRREALNVVLASTGGQNACNNKRRIKGFKLLKCGACSGGGCQSCQGQGVQNTCCEVEVPCQSCGACCGRKVQEKLELMAYKQKDNGCWYEPLEELRTMAANALQSCPPLPPASEPDEPPVVTPKDLREKPGKGKDKDLREGSGGGGSTIGDSEPDDFETSTRRNGVRFQGVSHRRPVPPIRSGNGNRGPAPSPNMVKGTIKFVGQDGGYLQISLEDRFAFPVGSQALVSLADGTQIDFRITKSGVGVFNAESDLQDRRIVADHMSQGMGVWVGIIGG